MAAVARLNDASDHGGRIVSASADVFADGVAVARAGDLHACPVVGHGTTPLTAATSSVQVNGRAVIAVGDRAGCGARIVAGSPTVFRGEG